VKLFRAKERRFLLITLSQFRGRGKEGAVMPTALMLSPLLLGKQEAWRRFCQKLQESHADEYRAFRRRLGITKAQIWLFQAS